MEQILSGYCRTSDASRMVLVEDGEADCDFEVCAYRDVRSDSRLRSFSKWRNRHEYLSLRRVEPCA